MHANITKITFIIISFDAVHDTTSCSFLFYRQKSDGQIIVSRSDIGEFFYIALTLRFDKQIGQLRNVPSQSLALFDQTFV